MQGVDIVIHLPLTLPVTQFATYRGHWLRCVCEAPVAAEAAYSQSPRITGLSMRAIGGSVPASQCEIIRQEVLGESDGSPGQVFRLQGFPVLERQADEAITITQPNQPPQSWEEVEDFAASGPSDRHYVIDSITGLVQFGPRVREPSQLRQRSELQTRFLAHSGEADPLMAQMMVSPEAGREGLSLNALQTELRALNQLERQYGAIPPPGAMIRMSQYRTGGGQRGNVQAQALTVPKSAVPYVALVTNHGPARHGADAESLEQAAIRVPQLLRTRNRAVTPEDFESLALQGGQGAIARARCLPPQQPGVVQLMLIPQVDLALIPQGQGLAPERLALTPHLQRQVLAFLDKRRLLGTHIQCQEPDYVGVTVQTEIALDRRGGILKPKLRSSSNYRRDFTSFSIPLPAVVTSAVGPWGKLSTNPILSRCCKPILVSGIWERCSSFNCKNRAIGGCVSPLLPTSIRVPKALSVRGMTRPLIRGTPSVL